MRKTPDLQKGVFESIRTDNSKVIDKLQKENKQLYAVLGRALDLLESEGYSRFVHNAKKDLGF